MPSWQGLQGSKVLGALVALAGIGGINLATASADEPCRLEPPAGVVAATGRRRPVLAVGKDRVIVIHRSPRGAGRIDGYDLAEVAAKAGTRSDGGPDCSHAEAAVGLALPLGSKPPETLVAVDEGMGCVSAPADPLRLVSTGEDVALVACAYPVNLSWGCSILGPGPRSLGFSEKWTDTAQLSGFASRDGTFFGAALARTSRRLVGFVGVGGQPLKKEILTEVPDELELDGASLRIDPQSGKEAIVWILPRDFKRKALRLVMNDRAARVGTVQRLAAPEPQPGAPLRIEMRRQGKQPRLVALRPGKEPTPLAGAPADAARFGPSLVEHQGSWLLGWSEGMGKATRLRLARLDPSSLQLGPPTEISPPDREAGFASLSALGGHLTVAWDQKAGETWEIRVAEVKCR